MKCGIGRRVNKTKGDTCIRLRGVNKTKCGIGRRVNKTKSGIGRRANKTKGDM